MSWLHKCKDHFPLYPEKCCFRWGISEYWWMNKHYNGSRIQVVCWSILYKHIVIVILIAGIFPRASSNGAHGSQSDDSTYLVSDMRCSLYLTLDQQVVFSVARITGVANLPLRMWSSSKKSISSYLPWLLDRELNPGPGGTKLMLYHWAIHTSYYINTYYIEKNQESESKEVKLSTSKFQPKINLILISALEDKMHFICRWHQL